MMMMTSLVGNGLEQCESIALGVTLASYADGWMGLYRVVHRYWTRIAGSTIDCKNDINNDITW